MADENPVTEPTETETVLDQDETPTEEDEAILEGFDTDSGDKEEPAKESSDTPSGEEEKKDAEAPKEDDVAKKIKDLESHIANLNRALHQERQSKKETPKEEEVLSDAQIEQLLEEHKADPVTLGRIYRYISENTAKKIGREAIVADEIKKQKDAHDTFVSTRWPDLQNPESNLRKFADVAKKNFRLDDHPMGDFLAIGAMLVDQLPNIQKSEYERGKADGLKGKVDAERKKDVKEKTLTPSGGTAPSKKAGTLKGTYANTAKQLGMTPSQEKIYAKLIAGKNKEMEA